MSTRPETPKAEDISPAFGVVHCRDFTVIQKW